MPTLTQIRVCQIGACSQAVPADLTQHGVCLNHYLDDAFTRVSGVLENCRLGQPLDSQTIAWMGTQGDAAVKLLANEQGQHSEQRARLLELLLCLANVQEHLRQRGATKT